MLAIEFQENRVLMVEGKASSKKITVKKVHEFFYDESWTDSEGVIQIDVLADKLDYELKTNGFKSRNDVVVCFNHFSSIFRELVVPYVEGKKLNILVRSEMMNTLNLSNDYLIDYVVLNEFEDDKGHFLNIMAVAIHHDYMESYMKMFKSANLKVKVADFGTNTLAKMVDASNQLHVNQLSIVLSISQNYLRMHLFDSFDYTFTRSLVLSDDLPLVEQVVENLNKMIQFMYTKVSVQEYTQVILTGDDTLFDDIQKEIEENLSIPCSKLEVETIVNNQSGQNLNPYVSTIGTMIRWSK